MTRFEEKLLRLVVSNSVEQLTKFLKAYTKSRQAFEGEGFPSPLNINFISNFSDGYPGLPNTYGKTALHVAVEKKYYEVVTLLLEAGAQVDGLDKLHQIDDSRNTSLCYAISNDDPQMVQQLVDAKTNVNINDKVLLAFKKLIASSSNNRCEIADILIKARWDFDAMISHGVYLLHVSADYRDFAMIQLLLEAGVKVHLQNNGHSSALSIISAEMRTPNQAQVYYDTNIKIIAYLLGHGAGLYGRINFMSEYINTVNKIVIGLEYAPKATYEDVSRKTSGFEQAITNLEELKAFMQTTAAYSAESIAHLKHVLKTCEEMLADPNVKDKKDLAAIAHELQVIKCRVLPDASKVTSLKGICLNNLNGISASEAFNRTGFFRERSKVLASKDPLLPGELLEKLAPVSMELVK